MQPLRFVALVGAVSLPVTSHSQSCPLHPGTHIPRKLALLDVDAHSTTSHHDAEVSEHLSHGAAIGGCLKQ
jgi:hypothetical protein